jgi:hypothetical protein
LYSSRNIRKIKQEIGETGSRYRRDDKFSLKGKDFSDLDADGRIILHCIPKHIIKM